MAAPDRPPLWREIARQSFFGKRGLSKTGELWLPVAVLLLAEPSAKLEGAGFACLFLFAANTCRTQALILANDLADRADDRAVGKRRWIAGLPVAAGVAIVASLLLLGTAMFVVARAAGGALAAYVAAVALGALYSLRPARFKERGLAGLVAYGAACAMAYVVVPWAWFDADSLALALLLPAVFLDRWVNLHFHQVVDHDADAVVPSLTYAVRVGLDRARITLRRAAGFASVSFTAVLALAAVKLPPASLPLVGFAAAAAVAAGFYARGVRRAKRASPLVREVPWHYLGLTFAVFRVLPPLVFAGLAAAEPTMWVPAAVAALTSLLEARLFISYRHE